MAAGVSSAQTWPPLRSPSVSIATVGAEPTGLLPLRRRSKPVMPTAGPTSQAGCDGAQRVLINSMDLDSLRRRVRRTDALNGN